MEKDLNKLVQQSRLKNQNEEDSLVTKYDMGNALANSTLSRDLLSSITVPRGNKAIAGQPVDWQVSIDKSNVELVVNYVERATPATQPGATGGAYEVQLVGSLVFNVILFVFDTVTDSDGLPNRGIFSDSGEVPLNESLGFVDTFAEVEALAMQELNVTVVNEIVRVNGQVQDGSNSELLVAQFDGREDKVFQLRQVLSITLGETGPIIS